MNQQINHQPFQTHADPSLCLSMVPLTTRGEEIAKEAPKIVCLNLLSKQLLGPKKVNGYNLIQSHHPSISIHYLLLLLYGMGYHSIIMVMVLNASGEPLWW